MLVRRLLRDRLGRYYAQPAHAVVGTFGDSPPQGGGQGPPPPSPPSDVSLPFSSLWGEWHWKRLCHRLYEDQKGQWLTPVELFRPYYSRAVARWAASTTTTTQSAVATAKDRPPAPWEMIEVGGGRGTNAAILLDYLRARHPDLYEACVRYTMVDASPTLHELQRNVLRQTCHRHKLKYRLLDLVDVAEGRESLLLPSDDDDDGAASHPIHTVVLALEVLDNLPHDKVRRIRRRSATAGVEWEQAEVDGTAVASEPPVVLREVFRPLSDPLLRQIVLGEAPGRGSYGSMPTRPHHPSLSGPVTTMWIPSVACGVILSLARDLQQTHHPERSMSLLAADFDWLPPPDRFDPRRSSKARGNLNHQNAGSTYQASAGEPLVTCMDGYDHSNYLDAPVLSDILFPTDFGRLAEFGRSVFKNSRCRVDVRVDKQAAFLRRHDDPQWSDIDRTKSWLTGYSPLLEDFANCSVLTMNVAYARE